MKSDQSAPVFQWLTPKGLGNSTKQRGNKYMECQGFEAAPIFLAIFLPRQGKNSGNRI
jgi:uncharacterized membrane protein